MFTSVNEFSNALVSFIKEDTPLKSVEFTAVSNAQQLADIVTKTTGAPKAIICQGGVDFDTKGMVKRWTLAVLLMLEISYTKTTAHIELVDAIASKFQGGCNCGRISMNLSRYYPYDSKGRIVAFLLEIDCEESATKN